MSRLPAEFYRPDGSRKPYHERQADRAATPERGVPMTAAQYQATRKAQQEGAAIAQEAREAREPRTANPYTQQLEALQMGVQTPQTRRRAKQYQAWAKRWDEQEATIQKKTAWLEKLANDPAVQRAIEYVDIALKTAADEDRAAYTRILAIASEGESKIAWTELRDLESQVWAREDKKRQELKPTTAATAQYAEQTERAAASLQRLNTAEREAAK